MKTFEEIIEAAKRNKEVTKEELVHALLVSQFLLNMDHRQLRETLMAEKPIPPVFRKLKADESFKRYHNALNVSPETFLGDDVPSNPAYQERLNASARIFEKIMNQKE